MAGDSETLRDVLSGFNTMQMRMGLTPGSSSAMGMPPMAPPQVKHPGEISAEAMARFSNGGVGFSPAASTYASQYQQGMSRIQAGYQNPFVAQQQSVAQGGQGFSMLPDPISMTAPSMGVFRPGFTPPPPMSVARSQPIFSMPFSPQLPAPFFQSRSAMALSSAEGSDSEAFSTMAAGVPTAARMGMGMAGAGLGMLTGAHLMKQFGPMAQGLGRIGGLIGGAALGFGALGRGAESMAGMAMEPVVSRRMFGEQMQGMSRNFVVGGPDMDESGRGMSLQSSLRVTNQMRKDVGRGATGGFNMRDMMSITSQAADTGMMDMAQSGEQIIAQARNIARGLSSFMKLANEPDIRKAMAQMGQMRQMGLTIPETNNAMQQAQTYARMAGTTVSALGESAGMPGAMTFAGLGMSAGTGYGVGMAAGGMARQAVAGGAFSTRQLAMAGGVRGVQQTLTEGAAAASNIDFPMMAALQQGEGGKFSINQDIARRIQSGSISLSEQAGMAGANMSKFGARGVTAMASQMSELKDEMARSLGPMGPTMMLIRQAQNLQKEVGGDKVMTLGGALRAITGDEKQARAIELIAQDRETWIGMAKQTRLAVADARDDERARRESLMEGSSLTANIARGFNAINPFRGAVQGVANAASNAADSVSSFFSDREKANRAYASGGMYVPESSSLRYENAESQKRADASVGSAAWNARARGVSTGGALSGKDIGTAGSDLVSAGLNIAGSVMTMGMTDMLDVSSHRPREARGVQAVAALGGIHGKIAEFAPSITALALGLTDDKENARIAADAKDAGELSDVINTGVTMDSATAVRVDKEQTKIFREYARAAGQDASDVDPFRVATDAALEVFGENASWLGDSAATETAVKARIKKRLEARGIHPDAAQAYVDTQWKSGLGAQVMRQAEREATPDQAAAIAKSRNARGTLSGVVGKDLKDTLSKIEDGLETVGDQAGFGGGMMEFATGTGAGQFKAFKEIAGANASKDVMMLQAAALRAAGDTGAAEKLEDAVRRQDPDGYAETKDRVAGKMSKMSADQKEVLVISGKSTAGKDDPQKFIEGLKADVDFAATAPTVAKGFASFMEKGGMGSLNSLSEGDVEAAMREAGGDETKLAALAKTSPEAAKAVRALMGAKTKEDKAAAVGAFTKAAQTEGKTRGDTVGGKGAGGKAEGEIDAQAGALASFAAAIPDFAEATKSLKDVSYNLKVTQELMDHNAKR